AGIGWERRRGRGGEGPRGRRGGGEGPRRRCGRGEGPRCRGGGGIGPGCRGRGGRGRGRRTGYQRAGGRRIQTAEAGEVVTSGRPDVGGRGLQCRSDGIGGERRVLVQEKGGDGRRVWRRRGGAEEPAVRRTHREAARIRDGDAVERAHV